MPCTPDGNALNYMRGRVFVAHTDRMGHVGGSENVTLAEQFSLTFS